MANTIQQLSVFLENKEGRLDKVLDTLANGGVNIVALSLADSSEYGMLRMIVSNPEKGRMVLREEGIMAMKALIYTFFAKHGHAIHFNIFDPETLVDAQKNPEKYTGLQIRVCGWNVHFTDLAKSEQDFYIKRAFNIVE